MPHSADPKTETLLARVRGGDRSAADALFALHLPRLRRMVRARLDQRLASRVDPSDIVQDAMTQATRRLPEYLSGEEFPFYPWLRQIAWDRLVDVHRRHLYANKRTVRKEESLQLSGASAMQLADRLVSSRTSPAKHAMRKELRARVQTLLARLTADDREVLVMKHLEELSNAECAAVLGISVEAVKKRYLRALTRVRALMDNDPSAEAGLP